MLTLFLALAAYADCSVGRVIAAEAEQATLCVDPRKPPQPGAVLTIQRHGPVIGPSRLPFTLWQRVARVRIERVEGTIAEARVLHGRVRADDRVAPHGFW